MIYFIALLFFLFFAFYFDFLDNRNGKKGVYFILCIFLISLSGFRYRVGGDTLNYMVYNDKIPDLFSINLFTEIDGIRAEVGWRFLSSFAKLFGEEFYWLQFIHSSLVNIAVFIFFKRYTRFYFSAVLFYFITFYMYFNFEILRESVAISIFLIFGIKYLLEKRNIAYYITVGIMMLFHTSAVFLFLLPLLLRFSSKDYNYFYICTAIYLGGLLLSPYFYSFLRSGALFTLFDNKVDMYLNYEFTIFGKVQAYILYVLVPLVVHKYIRTNINILGDLLIVFAIVGSFTSLFTIFFRFVNYFNPILVLQVTYIFVQIIKNRQDQLKLTHSFFFIIFIFVFYNFKLISTVDENRNIKWYSWWYPYYSIFEQVEDADREYIWQQQFEY